MKKAKKALAILLCAALLVGGTIAGTVAYLTAKTGPVTNTFTAGNVAITLDELDVDNSTEGKDRDTANAYNLIPGNTYVKDPTVHVAKNSENSWIFVKVENGLKDYLTENCIENQIVTTNKWTALEGVAGVYYKEYTKNTEKDVDLVVFEEFTVAADNKLGTDWTNVKDAKIIVTAYAVQKDNLDVTTAWNAVKDMQ